MKRRDFVKTGILSVPSMVLAQMPQGQANSEVVPADADRLNETHSLGFSKILFKVSSADTGGGCSSWSMKTWVEAGRFVTCILLRTNGCK